MKHAEDLAVYDFQCACIGCHTRCVMLLRPGSLQGDVWFCDECGPVFDNLQLTGVFA